MLSSPPDTSAATKALAAGHTRDGIVCLCVNDVSLSVYMYDVCVCLCVYDVSLCVYG